jgi:predicted PilT family ATPase
MRRKASVAKKIVPEILVVRIDHTAQIGNQFGELAVKQVEKLEEFEGMAIPVQLLGESQLVIR